MIPCKVVPCHHGIVCLQVKDGDHFQIWRVAVNILNKLPWTGGKGRISSLVVGYGPNNQPLIGGINFLQNVTQGLELG
jgi:hypothetical protein